MDPAIIHQLLMSAEASMDIVRSFITLLIENSIASRDLSTITSRGIDASMLPAILHGYLLYSLIGSILTISPLVGCWRCCTACDWLASGGVCED